MEITDGNRKSLLARHLLLRNRSAKLTAVLQIDDHQTLVAVSRSTHQVSSFLAGSRIFREFPFRLRPWVLFVLLFRVLFPSEIETKGEMKGKGGGRWEGGGE